MRVRRASARSAEGSRGCALCGRTKRFEPVRRSSPTPYDLNYTHPNIYVGAGRDIPEPKNLTEVRIGFFGPIEHNPEQVFGLRMLHGAQLAVEEANARGGYGGKPFKLMLHNDYDNWQAKTVYGEDRPTDPTIWGSASNEVVKMVYDDRGLGDLWLHQFRVDPYCSCAWR